MNERLIFTSPRPPVTIEALAYVGVWALILGLAIGALGALYLMGAPRC